MKSFHRRSTRSSGAAPTVTGVPAARSGRRVDQLLVDQGLAASRTQAQRLIEAGRVRGQTGLLLKAAQLLPEGCLLEVVPDAGDCYVSRGGLKLAGALRHTAVTVQGRVCLDVGQSTGGFSDCLLQQGAIRVLGVDVGHGQLHPRLRQDARVLALEGINCRALTREVFAGQAPDSGFDCIVADVSFISLTLILPCLPPLLAPQGDMLLLVKPQFEVGPAGIGKGGVVRDTARYAEVEQKLRDCCARLSLRVVDWFASDITGGDGNREFFIWIKHEN